MKITAEEKISKARTQLSHEHRFIGAHALAMSTVESSPEAGISTMATDYSKMLWYRGFVDELGVDELKFVIAHEAMHRIFMHPFRIRGRIHKIANMAMDYAINPLLVEAGLKPPKDCLNEKRFHGKTWEQIYIILVEEAENRGKSGGGGEPQPGMGQGWGECLQPRGDDGKELSESQARQEEISAGSQGKMMAQAARMAGHLPGNLAELIDKMWEPEIDYEEIIFQVFEGAKPSGYSMRNPSKSVMHNFGVFASGRARRGAGVVGVGIDTSGSITSVEMANALGIINAVMEQTRPDKVVVLQFDHAVQKVEELSGDDQIQEMQIHGRGGTCFKPQFEHIYEKGMEIDQYLVITDGYGAFPDEAPPFPVTWLMTTDVVAPWGRTVRFEVKGGKEG